ncbi:terpene synthase family protein [Streptomyces sp. NBC_01304]|uniref:terpene synthase family protein n=1 Tax=Streptomyces sp. NBC_01304 TaxID=2903818 RepID=UPI002E11C397|nr:terpene synthase family protein [Streptomyces sp. NBC_01304]
MLAEVSLPFSGSISSDCDAARQRSIAWGRRHGLIVTPADERRYRAADIPDLMARWLPQAHGTALDLGVDALTFAALLDDQFDGACVDDPAVATRALAPLQQVLDSNHTPRDASPLVTAFADVWQRQAAGKPHYWQQRAAVHWRWFFEAFVEESSIRSGAIPMSIEEYLALRRKSGVVAMMVDLIEAAYGFETTPRVRDVPLIQDVLRIAMDLVDSINDLFSLAKEESRGDVHNLVLVIQRENGRTREQALTDVRANIQQWCQDFTQGQERLAAACAHLSSSEQSCTRSLVNGMCDAIGGFPHWSRRSGRYSQLVPVGQPAYRACL